MLDFVLAFCLGISSKIADLCGEHGWKPFPYAGYFFGLITGTIIAYLLITSPVPIATLMISILAGLLLAGKIDTPYHQLAVGVAIISLIISGIVSIDYLLFLIFTIVCVLDEKVNEFGHKRLKKHRAWFKLLDLRPLLEIATLLISIASNDFSLWLMLLSYDLGYLATPKIARLLGLK